MVRNPQLEMGQLSVGSGQRSIARKAPEGYLLSGEKPNSLARLVLQLRGVPEAEQNEILAPLPPALLDPFGLKDMDKAADTLLPVIEKHGLILVHGDYDTDGVTSTAVLLQAFRYGMHGGFPYPEPFV